MGGRHLRAELAEAIGVFALVLAGCGAIVADGFVAGASVSHVGVAWTFGLTIAVMVYALGHVSGAHFNPAITLGFAAIGHFPWRRVPTYIGAQLAGATAAAGMLLVMVGPVGQLGATVPAAELSVTGAVLAETLATALLAFVIAAVATDDRVPEAAGGLAIGLAVTIGALFAGPLTGGSMNPARTLGPAVVSGTWSMVWIYLAAPVVGSIAAMFGYELVRTVDYEDVRTPRVRPSETAADTEPEVAG
jgi:MIP family channel proteins